MRRGTIKTLKQVVDIRSVQLQAAELAAQVAAAKLREAKQGRTEATRALDQSVFHWMLAVADPRLGPALGRNWGAQVLRDQATLYRAELVADETTAVKSVKSEAWKAALARNDAAATVCRTAVRREQRRRDETQLNAVADRFSSSGIRS